MKQQQTKGRDMEELLKLLETLGVTDVDQIKTVVSNLISTEKTAGETALTAQNGELATLTATQKNHLDIMKKLGFDTEKHSDIDKFLSDKNKANNMKDVTLESLKSVVEELKTELTGERDLRTADRTKTIKSTALAKLTTLLAPKIYGAESTIAGILSTSDLNMDGDNVTIGGISAEDFTKTYLKDHSGDVRLDQTAGGGDIPDQNNGDKDFDNMSTLDSIASVQ
jgi:hypothetical protein